MKTSGMAGTNCLVCPNVPVEFFEGDAMFLRLHDACAAHGPLVTFVPVKSFRRLLMVFQATADAMAAKTALDGTQVEGWTWRLYFGQHVHSEKSQLEVPAFERNLLISPPGSPCAGWEQLLEDAPNQAVLAFDLMHCFHNEPGLDQDLLSLPPTPHKRKVVCSEGSVYDPELKLPQITIEDCCDVSAPAPSHGWIPPTALPPPKRI
ncbi:Calcipressin-domain-containing protein [Sporodiniella umbellata]|nr:Calcipressin-domain-containing protein [Sporodiniella umbellata]